MTTIPVRFIRHMQDRSTEWLSSFVMLAWGVALAMPGNMLDGQQFAAFYRFGMTEETWAAAFLTAAATRLSALWINGRWPKTPMLRMVLATFGAISWTHVSYLLYQGSAQAHTPISPGAYVYGIIALYDFLAIFRASVDVRYYKPK